MNDGGPIYPIVCDGDPILKVKHWGMTLRNKYADSALKALLSNPEIMNDLGNYSEIIRVAWDYADAMIEAGDK